MDSTKLQSILDYLCNAVGGDWLLAGGALVRLKFDTSRGTEDMDLVKIRHLYLSDEAAKNQLFRWLIAQGLGPEWVNTAMEPFVKDVPNWEKETVLIQDGPKGAIYRPTLTLFVYLKLRRASDIDLADIEVAVPHCKEGFDEVKFLSWADEKLKTRFLEMKFSLGF